MKPFKDFNFKLMVIQELMYNQELLEPQFDVYEFVKSYQQKKIDLNQVSYKLIPEVKEYFEKLDIPDELLLDIIELNADGGDDIYLQLCPHWDGEDDLFNVKSADDSKHLPNLKKVTLLFDEDDSILSQFKNFGIEADWV